jgi:hypothetical protein
MSGWSNGRRVTMKEAADELGLTVEAIRKRIQRGTLHSDKGPDGRRYVYLDVSHREVQSQGSTLIEELRDRVRFLERVLEEEREARTEEQRRHDTLMAQLMQRIPELEPPREQASPQEPPGAAETTPEGPQRAEHPATGGAQEGAQRPWWMRVFGG